MRLEEQPGRAGRQVILPLVLHGRSPKLGTAPDGGALHGWDLAMHPAALDAAAASPALHATIMQLVSPPPLACGWAWRHALSSSACCRGRGRTWS